MFCSPVEGIDMELEDLKANQSLIRCNLQITGPIGSTADATPITVESRVVTRHSDVVHSEPIKAYGNAVVNAHAKIGGLQGTTQRIEVATTGAPNCYWLPWGTGKVYMGQLGGNHDYFFTYTINGCGFMIGGTDTQPVVAHANLDSARLETAVMDGLKKLGNKPTQAVRAFINREVAKDQALTYEQFYGNLAAKLIDDGILTGPRVEVVTPDQYLIRAGAGFGAVFGVKGPSGNWSFYGNWGGQTQKIWR
jgi:hypothetical protein